jgi:hypothetical protein
MERQRLPFGDFLHRPEPGSVENRLIGNEGDTLFLPLLSVEDLPLHRLVEGDRSAMVRPVFVNLAASSLLRITYPAFVILDHVPVGHQITAVL